MKLKLTLRRPYGDSVDIVVTADAGATVGEVARELRERDPLSGQTDVAAGDGSPLTLRVWSDRHGSGDLLPSDRSLGEVAIASGCTVAVESSAVRTAVSRDVPAAAHLRVAEGPDRGQTFAIPAAGAIIGRDPLADVVLRDSLVSKRHARIDLSHGIELIDLNSANGILVDGVQVARVTVAPGQPIQIGDSWVTVTPAASSAEPPRSSDRMVGGAEPFRRSPRVEARYSEKRHPRPAVPIKPQPPIFSWIMLIAPVAMGFAMYLITNRVISLLFVAMAPLMMAANFINGRMKNRRAERTDIGKFEAQLAELDATLAAETTEEVRVRLDEAPSSQEVLDAAARRDCLLWTRRPEHWSFLTVRLGTAMLPSRNTVAPPPDLDDGMPHLVQRLRDLETHYSHIRDVPVAESLMVAGGLGVVGGPAMGPDALRALLVQIIGLHSPAELVVVALTSPGERVELEWLRWVPHTSSPQSPLEGIHLADTQPTVAAILSQLEGVATDRMGRRAGEHPEPLGPLGEELLTTAVSGRLGAGAREAAPVMPTIVVVVTEDCPIDHARIVQIAERSVATGIFPLWLASRPSQLPAVCRTFLDVSAGLSSARAHFVRHGTILTGVQVEGISRETAEEFGRSLAPLVDLGAVVVDASDLPSEVSMLELLGGEVVGAHGAVVIDRWRQNASLHDRSQPPRPLGRPGSLRALVGQRGVDAMHLDLRTQGPHALVGGTTGAGKSEFLQAWVLGMAAEYSPDRVTFLFIDYKGGAAFADCVSLPHCVGLVTDLSPHLVRRALTSLRSELRFREHLLNERKAKDLLELERRGDHDAPPALVLVIDEFAALSKEVPEFVEGVVDIAQRGRSLGIHLILATQRPAGVIKDNIRANTNLRIALRMADEPDSTDVIGVPVAAHFDPSVPGRGIAKSGPGRLTPFQSAYAGGRTGAVVVRPSSVSIHQLGFGTDVAWSRPEVLSAPPTELGPTDQVRLVGEIQAAAAAAAVPNPRKPWLPELSSVYDLAKLRPRTDTDLILGVADIPEEQRQRTVAFRPDVDGNLAVYGTSGSGKTVVLRALAISAGITPRGGPVHVYALDFAAGGLRQLEPLPHVGAVVAGDDHERVVRLLRTLQGIAAERAQRFPAVDAGTIVDYRIAAKSPDEPRILLLVDNLPAFREAYEVVGPRAQWYAALQQLMSEGRQLGIHVAFTADRPGSVPGSIAASVPRRVVLRLAEESAYRVLGVPVDVLDGAPPGRGVVDDLETQIAVLGGSSNVADQSQEIARFARAIEKQDRAPAPAIRALPVEFAQSTLPTELQGLPVLGLSDDSLGPIGFDLTGGFLIGGGPGSGRTNAVLAIARAIHRWRSDTVMIYFGVRRSIVPDQFDWDLRATTLEEIADAAKQLSTALKSGERKRQMAVVIEGVAELVNTPADGPLVELVKLLKRSEHFVIGEAETTAWTSIFPLYAEFRTARQGLLLQPEWTEGDAILKASFPKSHRSEFPPGRGMLALGGRALKVQLPLALGDVYPFPGEQTSR